jgi:hypothetical protein
MSTLFDRVKRKFNPDKYLEPSPRKRNANSDPAPEELFTLVSDALDVATNKVLADIAENGGDFGDGWRYNLDELIHGGAFNKQQTLVLDKKLNQLSQNIARTKVHVVATKIICGAEPQEAKAESSSYVVATNTLQNVISNVAAPTWK